MSNHPQDSERASQIASGSAEAAEEFAREFRPLIASLVRRSSVPAPDCEDVVQEALMETYRQLQRGQYHGDASLKTWTGHITHGRIVDYWRKQPVRTQMLVPLSDDEAEAETMAGQVMLSSELPAPLPDAETVLATKCALAAMPAQLRYILLFNRTAGYTIKEISRAFELTPGQVARRLYKAEEMFRWLVINGESKTSGQGNDTGRQLKTSGVIIALLNLRMGVSGHG